MYKVKVLTGDGDLAVDYTGCIQLRISDSGTISAEFHDGSNKVYKMVGGEELTKTPMTDEEVLATPGLGEWYQEMMALQEKQSQEATD